MRPDANTAWFTFTVAGSASYDVYAFDGVEENHEPYEFSIELVSPSASEDILSLIGKSGCLTIADRSGDSRSVHGIIRQAEQLHTSNLRTHYKCYLVPKVWFLGERVNHRIYQHQTVVEIIEQVLQEQGFGGSDFSFMLSGTYEPREYCVQYGESDLHFISRLCEEEGIFFFFEHTETSHCMHFTDREGGTDISGESDLRYHQGSGHIADTAVISRLQYHEEVQSNTVTYKDWNFEYPSLDLKVSTKEPNQKLAPVPGAMQLEQYRYPHLYQFPDKGGTPAGTHGKQYADVQLMRQIVYARWISGEADVSRLVPGYVCEVNSYPRSEVNTKWYITRVVHHGMQPQALGHEAPERGLQYTAMFVAIPEKTRFVPEIRHTKRHVMGTQTAIVTGPQGEEIFPDTYGRVKVQFFWDRADLWNDKTTCWIRVAQGWAGSQFGSLAIPRIGHEVVVTFLEGNPDRPLITGRVYHAENMPPYELPTHKTRTVFKSMSTPGAAGEMRGFNEFRIEDKKGEEEVYVHAEKDVNVHVKHDWKEHIKHDRHDTVERFRYTRIKGEAHTKIGGSRKIETKSSDNLTVRSSSHTHVQGKMLSTAGNEIHLQSAMKTTLESGVDMTIKSGGAFMRLTPGGIIIEGPTVTINAGGSAGSGTGASPLLPDGATIPEPPESPVLSCLTLTGMRGGAFCGC